MYLCLLQMDNIIGFINLYLQESRKMKILKQIYKYNLINISIFI